MQKGLSLKKHTVRLATWHLVDRGTHGVGGFFTLELAVELHSPGPVTDQHPSLHTPEDRIPSTEKPVKAPTGTNVHPGLDFCLRKLCAKNSR